LRSGSFYVVSVSISAARASFICKLCAPEAGSRTLSNGTKIGPFTFLLSILPFLILVQLAFMAWQWFWMPSDPQVFVSIYILHILSQG